MKTCYFFLEYNGEPAVGQYFVEGWSKNITNMQGSRTMQVLRISVRFRQKFLSIFMVTYLPTILMNIINQATNYLSGDSKYDLVITVNITSMMVLVSIYLSVSTSLPRSSQISISCKYLYYYPSLFPALTLSNQLRNGCFSILDTLSWSSSQTSLTRLTSSLAKQVEIHLVYFRTLRSISMINKRLLLR